MAKRKLNYRFHNPNPVEVTADYILKVMIEANTEKVEKILQENMVQKRIWNKYILILEKNGYIEMDNTKNGIWRTNQIPFYL